MGIIQLNINEETEIHYYSINADFHLLLGVLGAQIDEWQTYFTQRQTS
jgi:hypothetical protein